MKVTYLKPLPACHHVQECLSSILNIELDGSPAWQNGLHWCGRPRKSRGRCCLEMEKLSENVWGSMNITHNLKLNTWCWSTSILSFGLLGGLLGPLLGLPSLGRSWLESGGLRRHCVRRSWAKGSWLWAGERGQRGKPVPKGH